MRRFISSVVALLLFSSAAIAQPLFIGGRTTKLNITVATVVKPGSGRIATVSVIVAGSTVGTVNDTTTTGAAAVGNQVMAIPITVTGVYTLNFPMLNGIVVVPGTGQTLSVSYE